MDDEDFGFGILEREMECPICFMAATDCTMTPCGHNFCSECILECVNRDHTCPCCRAAVTKDQLVRNHHFDNVSSIITKMKDEASRSYFEKLIASPSARLSAFQQEGADVPAPPKAKLSPIEQVFQRHMQTSLHAYEEYYQTMRKKYGDDCVAVREQAAGAMAEAKALKEPRMRQLEMANSTSEAAEVKRELDEAMKDLQKKCEDDLSARTVAFDRSAQLLMDSYDAYLGSIAPAPSLLPIMVTISVPQRSLSFERVRVTPMETIETLRALFVEQLKDAGSDHVGSTSSWTFRVCNPGESEKSEERLMTDGSVCLQQLGVEPGSVVELLCDIEVKADVCFSAAFEADTGQTMDYATCKTCGFNWICTSCATSCHAGHELVPYIAGHVPTWACCYCYKTKKCGLDNIKTKKKREKEAAANA